MAKKSNVHPGYYKTAGREPVGQNTVHEDHKRELTSAARICDGVRVVTVKHLPLGRDAPGEKTNRPAGATGSQKIGGGHESQQPKESG